MFSWSQSSLLIPRVLHCQSHFIIFLCYCCGLWEQNVSFSRSICIGFRNNQKEWNNVSTHMSLSFSGWWKQWKQTFKPILGSRSLAAVKDTAVAFVGAFSLAGSIWFLHFSADQTPIAIMIPLGSKQGGGSGNDVTHKPAQSKVLSGLPLHHCYTWFYTPVAMAEWIFFAS